MTYHWLSTSTGQIVENFRELVHEVFSSLRYFGNDWNLRDKLNYTFRWKYSREGF